MAVQSKPSPRLIPACSGCSFKSPSVFLPLHSMPGRAITLSWPTRNCCATANPPAASPCGARANRKFLCRRTLFAFLTEASEFTEVDPDIIAATRRWLLQQATPQGAWMEKDSKGKFLEISALYETAYVVEVLARDLQHRNPEDKDIEVERQAIHKAIEYFAKSSHANSDPYDIALIALAKLAATEDPSQEIAT